MASTYTSWGQRRALGRRYATDPAYLLELERLNQEYSLIPSREARALQARGMDIQQGQFAQNLAYNREQAELNRMDAEEARKQQATAGMIGTAGNLATTAGILRAATMTKGEPFFGNLFGAKEAATGIGSTAPSTVTAGAATVTPAAVDAAASGLGAAGAGAGAGAVEGMAAGEIAAMNAGIPTTATGGTGATAGMGMAGAGMSAYLGPAAAAYAAPKLLDAVYKEGTRKLGQNLLFGGGGETEQKMVGGAAAGAATGAAIGSIVPGVGTVIGGIIGGVIGLASGKGCIIVTACTSADSEEVDIAREYRDRFLDAETLRGYYMIAERVVPAVERSKAMKRIVKRFLVDNLIAYGRHVLRNGPSPGVVSEVVTRAFLGLCRACGKRRTAFVRCNGEVV